MCSLGQEWRNKDKVPTNGPKFREPDEPSGHEILLFPSLSVWWSWFPKLCASPCSDLLGKCSQKQKLRGCVQAGRSCRAASHSWHCSPSPRLGISGSCTGIAAPLPKPWAVVGSQPLSQSWSCSGITSPNLELFWDHSTQTPLNAAQCWEKLEGKLELFSPN